MGSLMDIDIDIAKRAQAARLYLHAYTRIASNSYGGLCLYIL